MRENFATKVRCLSHPWNQLVTDIPFPLNFVQIKTSLQVLTVHRETEKVYFLAELYTLFYDYMILSPICMVILMSFLGANYDFVDVIGHGQEAENRIPSKFCPLP